MSSLNLGLEGPGSLHLPNGFAGASATGCMAGRSGWSGWTGCWLLIAGAAAAAAWFAAACASTLWRVDEWNDTESKSDSNENVEGVRLDCGIHSKQEVSTMLAMSLPSFIFLPHLISPIGLGGLWLPASATTSAGTWAAWTGAAGGWACGGGTFW